MAKSLQRFSSQALALRSSLSAASRPFSADADALVEIKPGEVGMVSGIPEDHLRRRVDSYCEDGVFVALKFKFTDHSALDVNTVSSDTVVIYSPARTATQQGSGKVGKWKINFLSTQKWENPLMGWTSTGDPYANVGDAGLGFDSEEAARSFAERHGWQYSVKKPQTPLLKPKAYADNFKWKGPPQN